MIGDYDQKAATDAIEEAQIIRLSVEAQRAIATAIRNPIADDYLDRCDAQCRDLVRLSIPIAATCAALCGSPALHVKWNHSGAGPVRHATPLGPATVIQAPRFHQKVTVSLLVSEFLWAAPSDKTQCS